MYIEIWGGSSVPPHASKVTPRDVSQEDRLLLLCERVGLRRTKVNRLGLAPGLKEGGGTGKCLV